MPFIAFQNIGESNKFCFDKIIELATELRIEEMYAVKQPHARKGF